MKKTWKGGREGDMEGREGRKENGMTWKRRIHGRERGGNKKGMPWKGRRHGREGDMVGREGDMEGDIKGKET